MLENHERFCRDTKEITTNIQLLPSKKREWERENKRKDGVYFEQLFPDEM